MSSRDTLAGSCWSAPPRLRRYPRCCKVALHPSGSRLAGQSHDHSHMTDTTPRGPAWTSAIPACRTVFSLHDRSHMTESPPRYQRGSGPAVVSWPFILRDPDLQASHMSVTDT